MMEFIVSRKDIFVTGIFGIGWCWSLVLCRLAWIFVERPSVRCSLGGEFSLVPTGVFRPGRLAMRFPCIRSGGFLSRFFPAQLGIFADSGILFLRRRSGCLFWRSRRVLQGRIWGFRWQSRKMLTKGKAAQAQPSPRLAQNLSHRFCRLRRRSLPLRAAIPF